VIRTREPRHVKGSEKFDNVFWINYKEYLLKILSKKVAQDRFAYSKKYYDVLIRENAAHIIILQNEKKIHVMKAMAVLSKYIGCYDKWSRIREKYHLKWTVTDNLSQFHRMFNEDKNINTMMKWLKDAYRLVPKQYGNILLFNTLTGLRPIEVFHCLQLVSSYAPNYINTESLILEHFRFPSIFIRRTKNAYISIISDLIINTATDCGNFSYKSLKRILKKNNMQMNMSYCRKIFATYLRINGIESEIIDLLQGRIPKSVFAKHYFKPDFTSYNKVRILIDQLYNNICK
jgi:intergrase/recombinase